MFRFDSNLSCDSFPREEISGLLYIVKRLNSTDILRLQLAQVPRTLNLVIFVSTSTATTMMMTEPIALPLAHMCRVANTYNYVYS